MNNSICPRIGLMSIFNACGPNTCFTPRPGGNDKILRAELAARSGERPYHPLSRHDIPRFTLFDDASAEHFDAGSQRTHQARIAHLRYLRQVERIA